MSHLDGLRTRLRLLFARGGAESRMEQEFRFHVDMETERLMRERDLDRREARRQALIAFGGVEKHKEALRGDRGLAWLGGMKLDLKLGVRMLAKYPGMTAVSVLGMAVAVAIGAVSFGVIYTIIDPALPLDQGDRVVAIQSADTRTGEEGNTHLHDLAVWRAGLPAVELLGAYRTVDRNLITPRGRPEPVRVAEMSASGFRVARVPPLMGRYFGDEDERPGAPPVIVIGYSVWQNRFTGRPDIVGQTLQLGATPHTIIGVMPRGFAFPVNNRIWAPLRLNPLDFERGDAPRIEVFGRLATNATLDDARTQLATIGQRLATEYPRVYEHVQTRVLPYARTFIDAPELIWAFHLAQLLISMLLVVIGTNVAVLVYARTATRMGEIAVRSALGASRRRIVAQLFAEALVLSSAAAVVGLIIGEFGLGQVNALAAALGGEEQVPFWMHFGGLSLGLVLYVAGLAVLAAVIVGVLPALKATRRDVHVSLQQLGAGGSGMKLGKTWTFLIVTQVAVAVACLPIALFGLGQVARRGMMEPGYATKEILTASLVLDREGAATGTDADQAASAQRYVSLQAEVIRRVEADPRISSVVIASVVPGDEPKVSIEAERTVSAASTDTAVGRGAAGYAVRVARVEPDFFDVLDIPIVAGRGFATGDVSSAANAVIVNRSFVEEVLGGGDPLGRRVHRAAKLDARGAEGAPAEPWYEIVGVVPDYPRRFDPNTPEPRLYQPLGIASAANVIRPGRQRTVAGKIRQELPGQPDAIAGDARAPVLVVRVRGAAPSTFADRLREITVSVDPMLRLAGVAPLAETLRRMMDINRFIAFGVAGLTLSVILLSAAGIYALMSFTITRRRREIGIRSALGAGARSVLWSVLSRAMGQIAIGIGVGIGLMALIDRATRGEMLGGSAALLLPAVAALMALVGLAAAVGPARRALRIQPTEALRADG